jgi:L,D-peptidoglycan transpeptidase YkuD (ErfK/YbiS/YcfS/YnhG family)
MHLRLSRILFFLFLLLLQVRVFAAPGADPVLSPGPLQAVVVLTPSWAAVPGTLQLFERESAKTPWRAVEAPYKAVVGRNGLAWGAGLLAPTRVANEPVKKEGDGKAPAGIFRLSSAFGYASRASNNWIRLPYTHATEKVQCVDDPTSPFYNQLVDTAQVKASWKSYEDMLLKDGQYRLGVVVDHNAAPVQPGGGSCIFVHIWKGPTTGTSGCTALEAAHVERLLRWLDPAKNPVLVQMPAPLYLSYQQQWDLPPLKPAKSPAAR